MRRAQALAALVVAAVLVGGAAYADRELGPLAPSPGVAATAASGIWYCPHGGGETDWEVLLQIANPGDQPAKIRVHSLGSRRPAPPEEMTVEPNSSLRVPVPADGRARTSTVEWFDQWVAAGWIAHGGGGEGGVAAEPCADSAGARWLLPDGTSETEANDDYIVVMNPFARPAVFSVVLMSERSEPVRHGELTNVELRPFRSRAIGLGDVVLGERTVATMIEVSVGRVVAGTLGITTGGGIRSSVGYLDAPPEGATFPGAGDAGRTDLVVMNVGEQRVGLAADLLEREADVPLPGLEDSIPPASSGRTVPAMTQGATSVAVAADGPEVAAARRTFGRVSDQGSTGGAAPASAWIVLPAVAGEPSHPALALANPGSEPAEITLTRLGTAEEITITVGPRRTASVPKEFLEADPEAVVVAIATAGTFVPASASYSLGREGFATYAVALGIPIPERWMLG
jgi:hypothetical protein